MQETLNGCSLSHLEQSQNGLYGGISVPKTLNGCSLLYYNDVINKVPYTTVKADAREPDFRTENGRTDSRMWI